MAGGDDRDDVQYLYKYRSLVGEQAEWVKRTLLLSELFFSSRTLFNDPFDCLPAFSYEGKDKDLKDHLRALLRERNYPKVVRRKAIRNLTATLSSPAKRRVALNSLYKEIQQKIDKVGVFSCSTNCDHVLMWSHYANSHKGICLRVKATRFTKFFGRAQRVRYHDIRPVIDLLRDDNDERANKALLTKADFWAYENEWRIVDPLAGVGVQVFPANLLDAIILGAQISDEDASQVRAWAKARQVPTKLLRARIDDKRFRVLVDDEEGPPD